MNWRQLFTPVSQLSAAELKRYMGQHDSASYQLLDVRQPKEYEEQHLPGALLLPLRELPGRLAELDPEKPVIVYCAVGGRSMAAAQFLAGQGQYQVSNLQGGIKAWSGAVARGPEWQGLELLVGQDEYSDGAALAYRMEEGLQKFYLHLAASAAGAARGLFQKLAGFEEHHLRRLRAELGAEAAASLAEPDEMAAVMEGGGRLAEALAAMAGVLAEPAAILALAMGIEAQAFDLYQRLARGQGGGERPALYRRLAAEEQEHLAFLAAELDKVGSESP